MKYFYQQATGEGLCGWKWTEINRDLLVDSTWSEWNTRQVERLMAQTGAKSLEIHTTFHGYRFEREDK